MRGLAAAILLIIFAAHAASALELFETHVRPLLARQCYACDGPAKQFSGLSLDSRAAILEGGRRGPVVIAGDPRQQPPPQRPSAINAASPRRLQAASAGKRSPPPNIGSK